MTLTYIPIASTTLSSSQSTVTFSSIPQTYTDLVLRCSVRETKATDYWVIINVQFNGDTGNNYSYVGVYGAEGSAAAQTIANANGLKYLLASGGNTTSNTFASNEMVIPNYTSSSNKPIFMDSATENNAARAWRSGAAGLWRNSATVSSILLSADTNFASGSTFHLYGII